MSDIDNAKKHLPLPALMHRLGLGEHAKKSARCPFHDDKHNSFSIWQRQDGSWRFKCHAGCGEGDEITFLEKHYGISNKEAIKRYLAMAGADGSTPNKPKIAHTDSHSQVDWRTCVDAFKDADAFRLVLQRRYSRGLCSWLKQNGLIGMYNGCFAFPVHDSAGNVVAAHCRAKNVKDWFYYPDGIKTRPLVIGELVAGDPVHVFESYWDALTFMDKSGERSGIIITRGAGNGKLVAGLIPTGATVYAWKQNDELKNGKHAGDEWLKDVVQHAGTKVLCPKTPSQFKDLNDWTRAGATDKDLLDAMVEAAKSAAKEAQSRAAKLAPLLDSICAFVQRYIVFQMLEQAWVIALWVAHCWVVEAFDFTAYLHINSPEKQCAKTRLLDCLALLVVKAWRAILPSEPVLFRKIESDKPTLLLDEADGIFTSDGKDERREALRSLLNAGFERGAQVPRCVGQESNQEVRNFAVFCAKAIAGIGRLPDTVRDRSVPIQLVRRSRDEKVERFRKREAEKEASAIRAELEAWAKLDIIEKLREARPSLPDALSDRQQDICEPLLAIADMAGGGWPPCALAPRLSLYAVKPMTTKASA